MDEWTHSQLRQLPRAPRENQTVRGEGEPERREVVGLVNGEVCCFLPLDGYSGSKRGTTGAPPPATVAACTLALAMGACSGVRGTPSSSNPARTGRVRLIVCQSGGRCERSW